MEYENSVIYLFINIKYYKYDNIKLRNTNIFEK